MVKRLQDTPGYTRPLTQETPTRTPARNPATPTDTPESAVGTPPTSTEGGGGFQPQPSGTDTNVADTATQVSPDGGSTLSPVPEIPDISSTLEPEQTDRVGGYEGVLPGMTSKERYARAIARPDVNSAVVNEVSRRPSASVSYNSVIPTILNGGEEPQAQPRTLAAGAAGAYPPPSGASGVDVKTIVSEYENSPSTFTLSGDQIVDNTEAGSAWNFGTFQGDSLVIHHTAGRGEVDGVIQTFRERGFPAHFIIDREGQVHQVLGLDQKGQHTKNSEVSGLNINNSNSWGVEIIATDDADVNEAQVKAAVGLANFLNQERGMPLDRVVGHGFINSHKQETEGATVVSTLASILESQAASAS